MKLAISEATVVTAGLAVLAWGSWVTRTVFGNKGNIERVCAKLDLLLKFHGIKEKDEQ